MMCVPAAGKQRLMAPYTKIGNSKNLGFTLIELLLVLLLIALLAGIVAPTVTSSIVGARESTLKENLFVLRKSLDAYYADTGGYPPSLDELVKKRYIRKVPVDPVTEKKESWVYIRDDADSQQESGIIDVRSGSDAKASDGSYYKEW